VIEIAHVSRLYKRGADEVHALEDVSLGIEKGRFVALMGPSGSGKSTLLNLLAGLDRPSRGEVSVAGRRLSELSEDDLAKFRAEHLGFVFQFFNLIPTLTVEENLLLPLELNGLAATAERAHAALASVQLASRASAFPDRLSGGEQQRVAIARALIHEPMLVLADEPTGNLDDETAESVLDLLERVTRGAGRTLIVVTHSEQVVRRADRVLALRHGRLQERAQPG
jgi:putative ABC transport system ATP-binding protein